MALTDSQLMMLEQLTYLTDGVYKKAGTSKVDNPRTVREMMSAFMDEEGNLDLSLLDGPNANSGNFTSGSQWAGMLRQIANDPSLMNLEIGSSYYDEDGATLATCYSDPATGKAYVTFRGTTGSREWHDNVLGLYQSDTACQQEALAFIESLPFDDITVTGHSKGGNKAMYVTLLSDKVKRCVAMDGQGFSKEFYDKYWAEVQKKGGMITNYSLDDDYVHILLSPVPNSNQVFCEGYNSGGVDNHSPSSYFEFEQNDNGEYEVVVQENGTIVSPTTENSGLTYLHEFTTFVINVMPYEDREHMALYLGPILAVLMEGYYKFEDGTILDKEGLTEYILSDTDAIGKLLAYIIKYVETYDLTMEELRALLEGFGMGDLADSIEDALNDLPFNIDGEDAFNWLITQIGNNLGDGKDDKIILWLLEKIAGKYADEYGVDINEVWEKIEDAYIDIGHVDPSTANNNLSTKTGKVRNFTINNYQVLIEATNRFSQSRVGNVNAWNNFGGENWFRKLNISIAVRLINSYVDHINDLNVECKRRIETVFEDVNKADTKNSAAMALHTTYLEDEIRQIRKVGEKITPYTT